MDISAIKHRILAGGEITADEALALADPTPEVRKAMREAAAEITAAMGPRKFDSCSIITPPLGPMSRGLQMVCPVGPLLHHHTLLSLG